MTTTRMPQSKLMGFYCRRISLRVPVGDEDDHSVMICDIRAQANGFLVSVREVRKITVHLQPQPPPPPSPPPPNPPHVPPSLHPVCEDNGAGGGGGGGGLRVLSCEKRVQMFEFSVALRPQRPHGQYIRDQGGLHDSHTASELCCGKQTGQSFSTNNKGFPPLIGTPGPLATGDMIP